MPLNAELIDIGINARILIGIDRHWALIDGVLLLEIHCKGGLLSRRSLLLGGGLVSSLYSTCNNFTLLITQMIFLRYWLGIVKDCGVQYLATTSTTVVAGDVRPRLEHREGDHHLVITATERGAIHAFR